MRNQDADYNGGNMIDNTDCWMPLLIGNYLRDTQHLDAPRHGCYLLWLMHYWTKGPLPNSVDDLVLIGRLRGADAPSIAQGLLKEFFTLEIDGMYHQKRADIEKSRWQRNKQKAHEKAIAANDARWKRHSPRNAPSSPSRTPQGVPKESPTPTPINTELKLLSPSVTSAIRPEEFGNTWNQFRGGLPKINQFTLSRKKKVLLRIGDGLTLEKFKEAIKLSNEKPFLRGDGKHGWKVRFDWLIQNDRNLERVFEEEWEIGGKNNGADRAAQTQSAFQQFYAEVDREGTGEDREADTGRQYHEGMH